MNRSLTAGLVWAFLLLVFNGSIFASEWDREAQAIPHVNDDARNDYLSYNVSNYHKAFAIAPGGSWGWLTNQETLEQARKLALSRCREHTSQPCLMYAEDDQVVFSQKQWASIWGPYLSTAEAKLRRYGRKRGDRLFNLQFHDLKRKTVRLSDLYGKVVLVHFWGSWCPPCLGEFPNLLKFYQQLQQDYPDQVAMVLLQIREPISDSIKWVDEKGFSELPLYDSGADGEKNIMLTLANGKKLPDRYMATVFPSSYIIDKNGVILFSYSGAIHNWSEYLPLIEDAVNNSTYIKEQRANASLIEKYSFLAVD